MWPVKPRRRIKKIFEYFIRKVNDIPLIHNGHQVSQLEKIVRTMFDDIFKHSLIICETFLEVAENNKI